MQVRPLFELLFRFLVVFEMLESKRSVATGLECSRVVSSCNNRVPCTGWCCALPFISRSCGASESCVDKLGDDIVSPILSPPNAELTTKVDVPPSR